MATLDVKDMFFMILLQENGKVQFSFTWKEIEYTSNRLHKGYEHSPTIAHSVLAKVSTEISSLPIVVTYQYNNDILIDGKNAKWVRYAMEAVQQEKMIALELDIPLSKCQGPTRQVKFMGA